MEQRIGYPVETYENGILIDTVYFKYPDERNLYLHYHTESVKGQLIEFVPEGKPLMRFGWSEYRPTEVGV